MGWTVYRSPNPRHSATAVTVTQVSTDHNIGACHNHLKSPSYFTASLTTHRLGLPNLEATLKPRVCQRLRTQALA